MQKNLEYCVEECKLVSRYVSRVIIQSQENSYIHYQAGQYIKIVHDEIIPFSIACAPINSKKIELHISHPPENIIAQKILYTAKHDKKLFIRGPYGSCTPSTLSFDRPLIFLARGTGFAPIKAIIEALALSEKYPIMHLYWGATEQEELYFSSLANQWKTHLQNFSYTPVLSRSNAQWAGKTGLLQQVIAEDYPDLSGCQIYGSAPENIIYDALYYLQEYGLAREFFYSDLFDYDSDN